MKPQISTKSTGKPKNNYQFGCAWISIDIQFQGAKVNKKVP